MSRALQGPVFCFVFLTEFTYICETKLAIYDYPAC